MNRTSLPEHELEILNEAVLGANRVERFLTKAEPSAEQAEELDSLVRRRESGEPLQYLAGTQSFRKMNLAVGPGVLVPRPETEMVVERCLELLDGKLDPKVLDIGTGSGAIALSLAAERPDCSVWATDISNEALKWARLNASTVRPGNVHLLEGDLFGPVPTRLKGEIDLVVSNPPYLSALDMLDAAPDVSVHEPRIALVAGDTGLEVHHRIVHQAGDWLKTDGRLVLETFEAQWGRLRTLLMTKFADVEIRPDLAGRLRIAEGRKAQ
ncbi:MAG: peptide chain release factor N(5)-glutamine methyltransferase [Actinomycetota bacterium]